MAQSPFLLLPLKGLPMSDRAEKLSERIPLNLSSREFMDLSRLANLEERSISEFIRRCIVRPYLYGSIRARGMDGNEIDSAFGDLRGPAI